MEHWNGVQLGVGCLQHWQGSSITVRGWLQTSAELASNPCSGLPFLCTVHGIGVTMHGNGATLHENGTTLQMMQAFSVGP